MNILKVKNMLYLGGGCPCNQNADQNADQNVKNIGNKHKKINNRISGGGTSIMCRNCDDHINLENIVFENVARCPKCKLLIVINK